MANKSRTPKKRLRPRSAADIQRIVKLEANRLVTVNLKLRHYINGVSYGPGVVKCSNGLAQGMLATEGRAEAVEEQFQSPKAVIIGPRNPRTGAVTTREVPTETFDTEYANANPAIVQSGANQHDNGSGNKF